MEGGVVNALLDVPWVNDRAAVLRSRTRPARSPRSPRLESPSRHRLRLEPRRRGGRPCSVRALRSARRGEAELDDARRRRDEGPRRGLAVGVTDYLELVHDYRATGDKSYLVQEFLPDAADYRAMVLDGEVVGAVQREAPDGWKHNVHRGASADGVELPPELRDLALDAAAALDVDFLGVDLLVTDDRAVVNETNARPTIDDEAKYESGFYDRLAALVERTAES